MSQKKPYGKRVIPVPTKLSEEEKAAYLEVGSESDRPLGYVVRELALRGLVEFRKDGKLRAPMDEVAAALAVEHKGGRSKKFGNG
jgi:hypothetical protein